MPHQNLPRYASIAAACKVGCFACGTLLDPAKVTCQTARPPVRYRVTCDSCGDPTTFLVVAPADPPRNR